MPVLSKLKSFFHRKKSSASDNAANNIEEVRQKTAVENMLIEDLDAHQLYFILNSPEKKKGDKDSYGGLGMDFYQSSDHLRHRLVSEAFIIDDRAKTAVIASPEKLECLMNAYKSGDNYGLDKNATKRVLCLALLGGFSTNVDIRKKSLLKLQNIYTDTKFKERHDSQSILKIIIDKLKALMTLKSSATAVPSTAEIVQSLKQGTASVVQPFMQSTISATQQTTLITKLTPVNNPVNRTVLTASQANVVKGQLVPVFSSIPVNVSTAGVVNNNMIAMVNAVRNVLLNHLDTWQDKTTFGFLFGGNRIEHPFHKGTYIRLPNGIARMVTLLTTEGQIATEVTDPTKAERIIKGLCQVAFERYKLGNRKCVRYQETNTLYDVLSSLTVQFSWKSENIMKLDPKNVTIDPSLIKSDKISRLSKLLQLNIPVVVNKVSAQINKF